MRFWHIGSPTYLCPHFFRELGERYVVKIFAPQRKIQNKFLKINLMNSDEQARGGQNALQMFTIFFACLLAVSMMVSPFLLSVSMWGLVAAAFWNQSLGHRSDELRRAGAWLKILVESFRNLFRRPPFALLSLLLLVRIPFLVLPWAFANLPRLTQRQLQLVLYVLVWALAVICIGASVNFALHFDDIMVGIGRGQSIPVPRNHIRFSLILATGILAGGWLWAKGFYWHWRWERKAFGAAVIFLFLFIHVLSVRSGIMGLYAALLFSIARFVWRTRRWGIGLIALIIIGVLPIVAVSAIPSFRMRVQYMLWDWQQYRQDVGNTYSDSERWVSLRAGWQLWQENPVLGVGAGDLPAEVRRVVGERYPGYTEAPKLPHNQFLYILAGTGLFGLALSLTAFFAPVFVGRSRHFYLFAVFQILVFASFLVEYTIETAMGVAFYLFYTLFFMKMAEEEAG